MLDIQKMIKTNNFADLLNSTEEERRASGGDYYLYSQLADYLDMDLIKEVLLHTFKNNLQILELMNNKVSTSEKLARLTENISLDDSILLP